MDFKELFKFLDTVSVTEQKEYIFQDICVIKNEDMISVGLKLETKNETVFSRDFKGTKPKRGPVPDYIISMEGTEGTEGTEDFLMLCLFYILKRIKGTANLIGYDVHSQNETILKNLETQNLKILMKSKILYYERFGFVYPKKRKALVRYFKSGRIDEKTLEYLVGFRFNLKKRPFKMLKEMLKEKYECTEYTEFENKKQIN